MDHNRLPPFIRKLPKSFSDILCVVLLGRGNLVEKALPSLGISDGRAPEELEHFRREVDREDGNVG